MNLEPLANLLEDAGFGRLATNIFLNMLPAEAGSAILLRNALPGTDINYEIPGYFKTHFQLVVRSPGYATGDDIAKRVSAALKFDNLQVDSQYYVYCRPRTLPVAYPLSKGNLLEFNVFFDVIYCEKGV
jgi:hypothetical protein